MKARKKADGESYESHPYLQIQPFLTKQYSKTPKRVRRVKKKKTVKKKVVQASLHIQTGRKLDLS